jgi:hypothetical protein
MPTSHTKKVPGPINPNPIIILTSDDAIDTIIDSPFKFMPMGWSRRNVRCIVQDMDRLRAPFPTKSRSKSKTKSNSKTRSRSKYKVDYRPVPWRIQLEAAIDDGEQEVVGQTVGEGFPLPLAVKVEPDLEIVSRPPRIEVAESPKSTGPNPATSNHKSKPVRSTSAVNPFHQKTIIAQADITAAIVKWLLDCHKFRDPAVTPGGNEYGTETDQPVLDPAVTKLLRCARNDIKAAVMYRKKIARERGTLWDPWNVPLFTLNRCYPLDYKVDPTQVWVEYMKFGSVDEGDHGERGVPGVLTPQCETVELVEVVDVIFGVYNDSPDVKLETKAEARVKGVKIPQRECQQSQQT